MPALLQRLQTLTNDVPIVEQCSQRKIWVFREYLEEKGVDFFQPLVRIHPLLEFEYSVHCTHLVHNFARITNEFQLKGLREADRISLIKQLEAALAGAELLALIYNDYLNVPREILRLQAEQEHYRRLLQMCGYEFYHTEKLEDESTYSLSQKVRGNTIAYNWHRLFTIRIRRVFITLLPFLQNWQNLSKAINFVDRFLGPTLSYVAWLYFIPRLLTNLVILFKHLFPNKWTGMADKEEQLDFLVRFETQLQRRWFQLGNDTAWLIGGVLSCFLFVGGLAPMGWYVTVSIFFFDVIMASIRAAVELKRIHKIREQYQGILESKKLSGPSSDKLLDREIYQKELEEIEDYQQRLEERFTVERQRVILGIMSTSALFLGMCCALPIFAVNPVIPLIGAVIVLTATLATFFANQWIDSHAPSTDIEKISEQGVSLFYSRNVMFPPPLISTGSRNILRDSSEAGPLTREVSNSSSYS